MDILLAVPQNDIRLALEILIREEPGQNVVGTVRDGKSLLALVRTTSPDLILLDWTILGQRSTALLSALMAHQPTPAIIVLGEEPKQERAIAQSGAAAFVLKGDPPATLLTAIQQVGESISSLPCK
jgi:DNA-binding NarL/FixJ family response regulator